MNLSAATTALVPDGVVTVTSTWPVACAGAVTVIDVGEFTVNVVAAVVPNLTALAPTRFVPVRVTLEALAAWESERDLPRRAFVRPPLERKPKYVDFESPVLLRSLARFLWPAHERAPDAPVEFTEMLPGADECWLEDRSSHFTSELRVVALDTSGKHSD